MDNAPEGAPCVVMLLLAALGVLLITWGGLMVLLRRSRGWTASTDGNDYGCKVDASGSFAFPLAPHGVHYVTKACRSIDAKALRLRYRITADSGVAFCPSSDPSAPPVGPTLYLQRSGDDWSGEGKFEAFRWWATFAAPPVTPGEHEIIAPLDSRWTAVETSNSVDNRQAFLDALANAARLGFTFGGGTGYGHGVYVTGNARFELLELAFF